MMNYQSKTKDELIKELHELQQENNSLKALYNKDITEQKKIRDVVKPSMLVLRILGIFAVVEMLIMFAFSLTDIPYSIWENLTDAVLLWVLSTPLVYWWVVKGLTQHLVREVTIAQNKAQANEYNYQILFDTAPDIIYTVAAGEGVITLLNPAFETITGWSRNEWIGKTFTALIHPDDLQFATKVVQKTMRGENPPSYELRILTKSGTYLVCEFTSVPQFELGKIVGLLSIARDITERKRADTEIKRSNRIYAVLSYINQMIVRVHDKQTLFDEACSTAVENGKFRMAWIGMVDTETNKVNPAASSGLTDEYLKNINIDLNDEKLGNGPIGRAIKSGIHYLANDIANNQEMTPWRESALSLGYKAIAAFPLIVLGKTIGAFMLYSNDEFFFDEAEVKLLDEMAIDISFALEFIERETQRKLTEEFLLMFRMGIEKSGDAVFLTEPNGAIVYVNPAFEKIFGFTKEETIGKTPRILKSENSDQDYYINFWNSLLAKKPVIHEIINKTKDGRLLSFEASINPIINEQGKTIGYLAIERDITERKLAEQELIISKEKAEESDRLKSAFLANMSHEIRTPMNGILGFAELLKEPGLTGEDKQEYIGIIENSGVRMLNIINDIIDISKIEAGLMKLEMKESNINEQIEYIYTFFKPEMEVKGIKFSLKNTLPAKEAIIKTDREKLYAILTNLVKNAIKYTNEGSIEFGYNRVETLYAPSLMQFYVKDTGMGIPKDRQSAIFERFIQADITDKMARQGAGLGLSISKAYVEMLGGKIWVESKVGIGSTFYFTLPYNTETEEKNVVGNIVPAQEEKNWIKKLKILIAEDDETSKMLITVNVEKFSKEILNARTGHEAVEICRSNPDLDLILMDIQMPVLNGHEATRQIRQFNKDVVIIAQTAFGLSGDREKAIEAGCNDYISKPIKKDELLSLIQKYMNR